MKVTGTIYIDEETVEIRTYLDAESVLETACFSATMVGYCDVLGASIGITRKAPTPDAANAAIRDAMILFNIEFTSE